MLCLKEGIWEKKFGLISNSQNCFLEEKEFLDGKNSRT